MLGPSSNDPRAADYCLLFLDAAAIEEAETEAKTEAAKGNAIVAELQPEPRATREAT